MWGSVSQRGSKYGLGGIVWLVAVSCVRLAKLFVAIDQWGCFLVWMRVARCDSSLEFANAVRWGGVWLIEWLADKGFTVKVWLCVCCVR